MKIPEDLIIFIYSSYHHMSPFLLMWKLFQLKMSPRKGVHHLLYNQQVLILQEIEQAKMHGLLSHLLACQRSLNQQKGKQGRESVKHISRNWMRKWKTCYILKLLDHINTYIDIKWWLRYFALTNKMKVKVPFSYMKQLKYMLNIGM